jgi:hypothetical protein
VIRVVSKTFEAMGLAACGGDGAASLPWSTPE